MLAAGQQDWYPGYAMSSMTYATTVATQSGVKKREIENSRGVGWDPYADTADLKQAPLSSRTRLRVAAGQRGRSQQGFVSAINVGGSAGTWDHGRLSPGEYRYFAWSNSRGAFAYTSNPAAF